MGTAVYRQLAIDAGRMRLDRPHGNHEFFGNLVVRKPAGNQAQHLKFTIAERLDQGLNR